MPKTKRSKSLPTSHNSFLTENSVPVPGSFYWLPPKNKHDIQILQLYPIEDGVFDHPVLVLSTNRGKNEVLVFVLTSLGGKTLLEYSRNIAIRRSHLPIYPALNMDNDIQLFLHSGVEFPKISYVKTRNPYVISRRHLSPYREGRSGTHYKLRADSMRALLSYAGSSLAPMVSQTPSVPPLIPRLSGSPSNTFGESSRISRYNLDVERAGGFKSLKDVRDELLGSRPVLYQNQQSAVMKQQSFDPLLSYGTSQTPSRNLVRGISYPQVGPWTSQSPLVSSTYRFNTREPHIDSPGETQYSATPTRSRCNILIIILFILAVFVTLGYLFITETKS